jgi:hypothetical protein
MKCKTRPDLDELIEQSKARVAAMTDEEREAMYAAQRESYVRGEMSWPKPRYRFVDGVKVYDSYEDYCA